MDRFALFVTMGLLFLGCAPKRLVGASSTVEELPSEPTADATPETAPEIPEAVEEAPEPAPAPPPPPAFVKVEAAEGFSVMMPKDPEVQRRSVPLKKSGTVQTVTMSATLDGVIYSVTRAEYPEVVVKKKGTQKMLSDVREGLAAQLKGTVSDEKDAPLQGYPGQTFTIAGASNIVQARSAIVGHQVYSLVVVYTGQAPERASEFLGSIELAAAPAPAPAPAPSAGTPAGPPAE